MKPKKTLGDENHALRSNMETKNARNNDRHRDRNPKTQAKSKANNRKCPDREQEKETLETVPEARETHGGESERESETEKEKVRSVRGICDLGGFIIVW